MKILMALLLMALLLIPFLAWGDEFTITGFDNDITLINEYAATTNEGSTTTGKVGQSWANRRTRLLMFFPSFNDSMSAAGAVTWDSARVGVVVYEWGTSLDAGDTLSILLHALTQDFVEAEATWNIYSTGNSWTTAGGDFNSTRLTYGSHPDSLLVSYPDISGKDTLYVYIPGASLSDSLANGLILVQSYLPNGNYEVEVNLMTDDYATASLRPFITAWYTEGGASGWSGGAVGVTIQ